MLQKYVYLLISFFLLLPSCALFESKQEENPVARVHDLYLYPSDLSKQMPAGINGEDSIRIARRVIEEWVKDNLLLKKAELYLAGSDYNIEKQLEDYRASLLTFRYKQEVLLQKLDTVVDAGDIYQYYTENTSNYLLNADMVKLTYVKVPESAPQIGMLRSLMRSDKDEDLARLEQYCISYASNYSIQSADWVRFKDFMQQIPLNTDNPGRYLLYNKYIELRDSTFQYFVTINEHIPEKAPAPLEMVEGDIRSVLLNKRKITLLHELESSVYKEGLSRNQAEIYK